MTSTSPHRVGRSLALGMVLGALTWAAWLGWDRSPSYDVITDSVQTPYVTLQVLGCALTVAVVTVVLAVRAHPVAGPGGVEVGDRVVWTEDAASQDDTGLFAVGALLLAFGLAAGISLTAATAVGVRTAVDARKRRRADRP
jgi:hypothetical protein